MSDVYCSRRVVIFYSMLASGEFDHYSLHTGCAVGANATKWAANFWMWNTPQQGRFPSLIGGQSALGRLAAELREPELVVAGLGGDRSRRERTLSSRVR